VSAATRRPHFLLYVCLRHHHHHRYHKLHLSGANTSDKLSGTDGNSETRRDRAESIEVGFLGRGQQEPPSHQLGGLGSVVSSPSGVSDGAPDAGRFSVSLVTPECLVSQTGSDVAAKIKHHQNFKHRFHNVQARISDRQGRPGL